MSTLDTMVAALREALNKVDTSATESAREYWLGKVTAYTHVIKVLRGSLPARFAVSVRDGVQQ